MPAPIVLRDEEILLTQERLAKQYGLSRQVSLMFALLVCFPTVTPSTVQTRIGSVDQRTLVARLRRKMRAADEAITIKTLPGFGYYLEDDVRMRLLTKDFVPTATLPAPVFVPADGDEELPKCA